jgi:hypothetical protein
MRKIILMMSVSVDGFIEGPEQMVVGPGTCSPVASGPK